MRRVCAALFAFLAPQAVAQDIRLPSNAVLTSEVSETERATQLPIAAWDGTLVPTVEVMGAWVQRSWRIDAQGLSTEQMMRSIREQLANARFVSQLDCTARVCGGFDFRFAVDVQPPPDMQVNLADYRFLSATRGDTGIMILASRTRDAGYLQITLAGQLDGANLVSATETALTGSTPAAVFDTLEQELNATGRAVLRGLEFDRGSAQLGAGPYTTLAELADLLKARPNLNIALVGHTDSEGSLDGNINLSKRRAGSVLERLASDFGVNRQQMEAEGMGYLSPIANNLTPEGREANRRVEVIITSTEN